jgi:hypothetical protein
MESLEWGVVTVVLPDAPLPPVPMIGTSPKGDTHSQSALIAVPALVSSSCSCISLFLAPKFLGLAPLVIDSSKESSPWDGLRRFGDKRRISALLPPSFLLVAKEQRFPSHADFPRDHQ